MLVWAREFFSGLYDETPIIPGRKGCLAESLGDPRMADCALVPLFGLWRGRSTPWRYRCCGATHHMEMTVKNTTCSFGAVALAAMAIVAVTFGSGCTNPSPGDEPGDDVGVCEGFCPSSDGDIQQLTVGDQPGSQPCNDACTPSQGCREIDSDGDGDAEETCVLVTCGNSTLDAGEDCDGGDRCLGACHCPNGLDSNLALGCETPCVPDCTGMICGDDGCDGTCGDCPDDTACSADQTECDCIICDCVPNCTADDGTLLVCGDDGCGGSCGTCPAGTACSADQTVCDCVPDCDGLVCGGDGCGGTCGTTCPVTFTCSADQTACNPPPPEVCDNGDDEDLDGDVDVADSDCLDEEVAALGCYFQFGATVYIDTAVWTEVSASYDPDRTGRIGINGRDAFARIRISAAALSCSSGQSFVVWPDCGNPGEQWPMGDGMVRDPGQSFGSTAPGWYCFFLAGATE